jgi:hypothetical protein
MRHLLAKRSPSILCQKVTNARHRKAVGDIINQLSREGGVCKGESE